MERGFKDDYERLGGAGFSLGERHLELKLEKEVGEEEDRGRKEEID